MQERKEIEKIPIEEAMELLRKDGIDVGREEAGRVFSLQAGVIIMKPVFAAAKSG